MTDLNLCYETAQVIARRIKAGEISARQVMENTLARIETVNPQLNCFCFVFAERAMAEAAAADEAQARGETGGGPLLVEILRGSVIVRSGSGQFCAAVSARERAFVVDAKFMAIQHPGHVRISLSRA